ncbi:hypothetical protein V8F06_008506 [Rhypophila decipiens]
MDPNTWCVLWILGSILMTAAQNVPMLCIGRVICNLCVGIASSVVPIFRFDINSMSGVLGTMAYKEYFGYPVSYRQGAITASMTAGSLVGSLFSSFRVVAHV